MCTVHAVWQNDCARITWQILGPVLDSLRKACYKAVLVHSLGLVQPIVELAGLAPLASWILAWPCSLIISQGLLVWCVLRQCKERKIISIDFQLEPAVCMFDKFHFQSVTSIPKCRVMFSESKNICQLTSTFFLKILPQCHMSSSTCYFNFECVNWQVVIFFTSHTTLSNSKLCMSIDVHFYFMQVFACQMSKPCKNFVKDACKEPTLDPNVNNFISNPTCCH